MAVRGSDITVERNICGTTSSTRSPKDLATRYTHYIGMVLAPKSRYPCSVFIEAKGRVTRGGFCLFTPNRKRVIGAGFYGDSDGPEGCTRQHMLPGLCSADDFKTGLGPAIYVGGVMVVQAAEDNERDEIPRHYTSLGASCTYSYKGSREPPADVAWANLHISDPSKNRVPLARYSDDPLDPSEYDGIEGEKESFEFSQDASDYIDAYSLDEQINEQFQYGGLDAREIAASRLGIDEDDILDVDVSADVRTIEGTVDFSGTALTGEGEVYADIIDFGTVAEAGLVLHLGPDFDPEDSIDGALEAIPPQVIGASDWSQTPVEMYSKAIRQQARAAGIEDGDGGEAYLRLCAEELRKNGWTSLADKTKAMVDNGEQLGLFAKNPKPSLAKARQKYAKMAREWDSVYGPRSNWS